MLDHTTSSRWLGVEPRHLAAFAAVAHVGSFRGAAEELGYVQSSVTQQIAALERLVGTRLVERSQSARPAELTRAGRLLLVHVENLLARLGAARADLQALDEAGPAVRVGLIPSLGKSLVPRCVASFTGAWPGSQVAATEAIADDGMFELVEHGDLDLAFATLPLEPGPFDYVELVRDPYVLLVEAASPMLRRPSLPGAEELDALRLIEHVTGREGERVEAQLRAYGCELEYVCRSGGEATVQSFVVSGLGSAIVPRLGATPEDPRTAIVRLDHLLRPRRLGLFWHRDRELTPAVRAFRSQAIAIAIARRSAPAYRRAQAFDTLMEIIDPAA